MEGDRRKQEKAQETEGDGSEKETQEKRMGEETGGRGETDEGRRRPSRKETEIWRQGEES